MPLTTSEIGRFYHLAQTPGYSKDTQAVLRHMLVLSLSNVQAQVYVTIRDTPGITNTAIAGALGIGRNHVATEAIELEKLGLITSVANGGTQKKWSIT